MTAKLHFVTTSLQPLSWPDQPLSHVSPVNTKEEATISEQWWKSFLKAGLNMQTPGMWVLNGEKGYYGEYGAINCDVMNMRGRDYYTLNCEAIRAKKKDYYTANREVISEKREYQANNRKVIRERAKANYVANRENILASTLAVTGQSTSEQRFTKTHRVLYDMVSGVGFSSKAVSISLKTSKP